MQIQTIQMLGVLGVIYIGFWCGVLLGFIARTELKHWFFKFFNINPYFFYAVAPFLLLVDGIFITATLLFLLGLPLGSNHVSYFVRGRKIVTKKKLFVSAFKKTSLYFVSVLLFIRFF